MYGRWFEDRKGFFRGMGFSPFTGFANQFGTFPDNPDGLPDSPTGDVVRRQLEAFVLAFDSNVAPIVGQQVTLRSGNQAVAGPRIDLLIARAEAGECDLVAKSHLASQELGFLYTGAGQFVVDRMAIAPVSDALLRQAAVSTGRPLTYTCAPLGSGYRTGVDRDEDGFLDGDERIAGSDPADPSDTP
ncbi:thrombospondin type 3 repeat-containing protein [Sorangium sp. So ce1128]